MRRATLPCGNALLRLVALCCLGGTLALSGCRGTNSPDESSAPAPLILAAGDRLVYDGWTTNAWGYTLDSSRTRRTWQVLTAAASGGGYNDAVMIREEIVRVTTNTTTVDTFLLRLTAEGYVLRYGFLADLVKRREARVIPQRWDTLAILNAHFWTVGTLDSAGQMNVSASVPAEEDYFSADVDGTSYIFTAHRVEMENERLQYAFWFSTNPPCFPRLEEASDPFNDIRNGSLLLLRQLWLAPR